MDKELVSVIMSTYNESLHDIERAVHSILVQTYKNFEFIIICDNPDNKELIEYMKQVKQKDSRIHIYENEKNMGLTDSLNKALDYAKGVYIARMDADDYSMPERLAHQKAFLEKMNYDVVGSFVECVDGEGKTLYALKNMPIDFKTVKKKVVFNNPLAHPTWFGKKVVFDKNEGYRKIPYAEDYDFLLRALTHGFTLGNVGEILFKYTIRDASISTSNGLKQYRISQMLIKAYKSHTLLEEQEDAIQDIEAHTSKKSEEKYAKAARLFAKAVGKAEKHNITFVFDVIGACLTSSYYFKKIIGYIKAFY